MRAPTETAADRPEIRKLADRLRDQPDVLFALLFGSRAGDRPRPDSDWDVAVYLDPALDARARFRRRLDLIGVLDDFGEIDLVVLNDAPALLAHRALMGERILIHDPTAYVRFFVRTVSYSEDQRYFRERDDRARLQRLKEGRFGLP